MKSPVVTPFFAWVCFVVFVLGLTGCSNPEFHITARNERATEHARYKIYLKGQELGTIAGSAAFEFDAEGRRGKTARDMLPQDIEVKIPWECGWVKTTFDLRPATDDEVERARADHRAIPAIMDLSYSSIPDFTWVTIFIDNRGGPPQTVSIGDLQEEVPAGATQRLMFTHSGGCDKAKDVRVNGEVVAPVNPKQTLLIDTSQSHCYRTDWASYGFSGGGHGKTIYPPRRVRYLENPVDFFMESLPGYVVTGGNSDTRSVLVDAACP